ncbi:hypothetical protein Tco_1302525 [Tanacetum coccineum]
MRDLVSGKTEREDCAISNVWSQCLLDQIRVETARVRYYRETEVSQPSSPTQTHVADEAASTDRVAVLENDLKQTKKTYGTVFTKLIKKVKTLEKTIKSNKARRRAQFVVSDDEEEDSFNQGRKISKIDEDLDISLVQQMIHHDAQSQGRKEYDLEPTFEFTAPEEVYTAEPDISTANVPVSTVGAEVSTAAESLVYIRRSAAKRKYKGKAIVEESEPIQTKTKIQQKQERLGTFKPEEWDNMQAQIETDEELAYMLQAQEREGYSKADKAKLLHMGSHTLQQLRRYSFDEIKVLFEATVNRVNTFTLMESDTVLKVVAESSKGSAEEDINITLTVVTNTSSSNFCASSTNYLEYFLQSSPAVLSPSVVLIQSMKTLIPNISTANVPVSTASAEVSTAAESLVYISRKRLGFEEAQRLQEQFDEEERQRIASVHKEASTFKPKEWDNMQAQIKADEELDHRLQAQEREGYSEADKAKLLHMGSHTLQQLRGYSFDEIKVLFEATMKRVNTFTPMKSDDTVPKVVAGSSKRSAEEELGEESSKRQKIGVDQTGLIESIDKESALQTKYPIIDWEVYTEDSRKYWKIIRVGDHTKRLFEPDTDDLLELQRYMHDPLTWRLYDTCGVHHVSIETRLDIFMLVEKDYPMTRGLPMLMLVNKLQVDQHSEMAYELLRKIFILANRPRH